MKLSKYLTTRLEVKDSGLGQDGTFTGYASVFGEVDSYNEVVQKGAFAKSLEAYAAKGKMPKMLRGHDPNRIPGSWKAMNEDDVGLRVGGQLAMEVQDGKDAHHLLKMDALDGLSIGYVATKWEENKKSGVVTLTEIDLWEVSLVTFPAGPSARVDGVKSLIEDGKLVSMKECEEILRDAGLSRSQAKTVAGRGYSTLLRQCDADGHPRELNLDELLSVIYPH